MSSYVSAMARAGLVLWGVAGGLWVWGCNEAGPGLANVPVYPIHQEHGAWSEDGRIAYRDNGIVQVSVNGQYALDPGAAGIWVVDRDREVRTQVTTSGDFPFWRPEGGDLCFWDGAGLFRIDGSDSTIVAVVGQGCGPHASWWRDGESLALEVPLGSPGKYAIGRYWVGVSTIEIVHSEDGVPCVEPSVSPDGCIVLYRRLYAYPNAQLRMLDLTSGADSVINKDGLAISAAVWAPDGIVYAFTGTAAGGACAVYIGNREGDGTRRLSREGGYDPSWSPDGGRIVYTVNVSTRYADDNGVLWVVDVATGEETQLTEWRE